MENKIDYYVDYINENILATISYDTLQESYETDEKVYMKEILNALHKSAVDIYGTEYFDRLGEDEYVLLPGIVRGRDTGNICIAMLGIDLMSSGEHCETIFLTKYGPQASFEKEREKEITDFIHNTYGIYDYTYTLGIENDIHIDFEKLHPDMTEILNTFGDYSYLTTENSEITNTNNCEDIER